MGPTWRAVGNARPLAGVIVVWAVLLGCSSPPSSPSSSPSAEPGTNDAIRLVEPDFMEFEGGDIFGDVAAGAGSVWVATREGLIQVDSDTMDATWHADLAPGIKIVYAFDSLWIGGPAGLMRVDPISLEVLATIRIDQPEGVAADSDSIWASQHEDRVVLRIDPGSHKVAETIDVAGTPSFARPMVPSIIDGEVWVAIGNSAEVVRIDADRHVARIDVERQVLSPAVATTEAIWFSNGQSRRITRIDRVTGVVSTSEELPRTAPERVAAPFGPGINVRGTLWFPTQSGAMVAIDPVTFAVIGTIPLRGSIPRKAIEYDGAVWVMNEYDGSLERIALERLAQGLVE